MNLNTNFLIDVLFLILGLHFTLYLIYGRTKRRSLVGGYKPGKPGYEVFIKLVDNTKYLVFSVILTLFFLISTIIDGHKILQSSSTHSILVFAPVVVIATLSITLAAISKFLKRG